MQQCYSGDRSATVPVAPTYFQSRAIPSARCAEVDLKLRSRLRALRSPGALAPDIATALRGQPTVTTSGDELTVTMPATSGPTLRSALRITTAVTDRVHHTRPRRQAGPYHRRMALEELHLDRARAEVFGSIAGQYDRYRPTYPEALIEDLVALRPERVLDVGCGTGKVASDLTRRGLSVLGVEPDERMAQMAHGHGVPVEVASFENWDGAGRQFDLITCGAAWQWIDPHLGVAKAAKLLRAGGIIARFWTYYELDRDVVAAFDAVYRVHAPETRAYPKASKDSGETDPFGESDAFSPVETRIYQREHTLSADEWVGLAATFSNHQRLGPERLAVLLQVLHATIESLGGSVHTRGGAYVLLNRREPTFAP